MKIALIIGGAIVALTLIVLIVGYSLPVGHRASHQAEYAATPEALYRIISNVQDGPTWRASLKSVEQVPSASGEKTFRENGSNGPILYAIEEATPNSRFVTRIADKSLPFGGTWTYDLTPTARGTVLRITENGEVYNPIFRFMSKYVMSQTATIDAYLDDLSHKVAELPKSSSRKSSRQ